MKRILVGSLLSCFFLTNLFAQTKKPAPKQPVAKKTITSNTAAKPTISLKPVSTEKLVEISTNYGTMIVKLYDSTPLHKDNFIKLVKQGFYDSLLFHRVINGFMLQGGDPASKTADSTATLGGGSAPGDRIPAEFKPNFFHKKGALAAARDNNPEKASSNCQFYIVQGRKVDPQQLGQNNPNVSYTAAQKEIYQRLGGTPFLDQNYTVFGEVISGLEVIDKIAAVQTQPGDRPVIDVRMKMRLLN